MTGPVLVGGAADLPPAPHGYGLLVVRFWFTSAVELRQGARVVNERPNYDRWIPPPVLLVDGEPVRASWARWCYPLPAGGHELTVTEPAAATTPVQLGPVTVERLDYRVAIVLERDHTDRQDLGVRARGGFTPG